MDTLRILQLDFVNVLIPAHQLVVWSRLGAFDLDRFQRFVYNNGSYTEHWAHEASIVPAEYWPVLGFRRANYRPWKQSPVHYLEDLESYLRRMLERIEKEGELTAADFDDPLALERVPGEWHRSLPRHALEVLFGRGQLSVRKRLGNFQRVYDLPSRVLPAHHALPELAEDDAHRRLLADAARALGIASAADLADYFRMSPRQARQSIEDLVDEGEVVPVEVEGWSENGYLSRHARAPRAIPGASLISPFDPLVWCRPRTERVFGFRYRIEIYVPAAKRQWGYYVLPFRLGENLVGRLDLKAERKARELLVRRAYVEEDCPVGKSEVAHAMARELRGLGTWLGLEEIVVKQHNAFSNDLKAAVTSGD